MAKKEFILQGFTSKTHAVAVRSLFENPQIVRAVISVAFVRENGVRLVEDCLRAHGDKISVFAGIRNDITSYQGLLRLQGIPGLNLFTVDTGRRCVVFHPKLFLVKGTSRAGLAIGSANLTLGGMNNNIEAGMLLDFDLADADDLAAVDDIESQVLGLPARFPKNITRVATLGDLDRLNAAGLLQDESVVRLPPPSAGSQIPGNMDTVPPIHLAVPRQPRSRVNPLVPAGPAVVVPDSAGLGPRFELVWESKPLTRSDLDIPIATGTNLTGAINLDKGLLPEETDQRHYFREKVFQFLAWKPRTKTTEEASARFTLFLKGIGHGEFVLWISHTTSTTTRTYLQGNAVTRLRWGQQMKPLITRGDLIGRTLSLYRELGDPTRFRIEID